MSLGAIRVALCIAVLLLVPLLVAVAFSQSFLALAIIDSAAIAMLTGYAVYLGLYARAQR